MAWRHVLLRSMFAGICICPGALLAGCTKTEVISAVLVDSFDRAELGARYHNTGGPYEILDGKLNVKGAYNHPLWLRPHLPRNAVIEFDAMSKSAVGDIKVEAWGDGRSHATTKGAYLATSYVFVLGGWHNRISAIARLDEHGADRKERSDFRVVPGQSYRWRIERRGPKIDWYLDGKPFLSFADEQPLEGERHSAFGFNNWESDVYFDNLKITPLGN